MWWDFLKTNKIGMWVVYKIDVKRCWIIHHINDSSNSEIVGKKKTTVIICHYIEFHRKCERCGEMTAAGRQWLKCVYGKGVVCAEPSQDIYLQIVHWRSASSGGKHSCSPLSMQYQAWVMVYPLSITGCNSLLCCNVLHYSVQVITSPTVQVPWEDTKKLRKFEKQSY